MNVRVSLALCGAIAGLAAPLASAAVLSVDDFESYSPNQLIAPSFNSTPWLRFGQVEDGLYATAGSAMSGTLGAEIPVAISGTGAATTARNFGVATDLSSYATATVESRSLTGAASAAALQLSISNGATTYLSNLALPITGTAATYAFPIAAAELFLADGPDSFATVLAGVTAIGFRISSPTGGAAETIAFDSFALQTAVPEPVTLGTSAAAASLLVARRRRR